MCVLVYASVCVKLFIWPTKTADNNINRAEYFCIPYEDTGICFYSDIRCELFVTLEAEF